MPLLVLLGGLVACGPDVVVADPAAERAAPLPFDDSPLVLFGDELSLDARVAVADVDGDGWPDVLAAPLAGQRLLVLPGGPAGFGEPVEHALPGTPEALATADADGDGYDDVLVGMPGASSDGAIRSYRGSPAGLVLVEDTYGSRNENGPPGRFGAGVVSADLDGDGTSEFVAVNAGRQMLFRVFLGEASVLYSYHGAIGATFTGLGTMEGGYTLGVVTSQPLLEARVYKGTSLTPVFTATSAWGDGDTLTAVGVGDVDGNGHQDIIVKRKDHPEGSSADRWAGVHWGSSGGWTSSSGLSVTSSQGPEEFAGADFDGDGKNDVIHGNTAVAWLYTLGANGIEAWNPLASPHPHVATGDLDRDGYPDAVFGSGNVLYGTPFGAWRGAVAQEDLSPGSGAVDGAMAEPLETSWAGTSIDHSTALSADARLFFDSECDALVAALAPSTPDFGGQVVVYLDATEGGLADTAGLTDVGDAARAAVSGTDGTDRSVVTFPEGFTADHALVFTHDAASLYRLVEGGSHEALAASSASGAVVEVQVSLADLGWSDTAPIGFVGNHLDVEGAGRTTGIVGVSRFLAETPGWDDVTLPSFGTFFPHTRADVGADALVVDEGGSGTVDVLANDHAEAGLVDASLAFGAPAHGTAVVEAGDLRYTHDGSEAHVDAVPYTFEDSCGSVFSGTVTVTVNPVDDVASWSFGSGAVTEDAPTPLDVALIDPDFPDDWIGTLDLGVSHGALTSAGVASVTAGAWGTAQVSLQGTLTQIEADLDALVYTPDAEYSGPDALDLEWDAYADGTLELTVTAVDDPPVTSGTLALAVDQGGSVVIGPDVITATDVDSDPSVLSFAVSEPSHGAILVGDAEVAAFTLADLGSVTYRHSGAGTTSDSFTVTVSDASGPAAPVTITVTVTGGDGPGDDTDDGPGDGPGGGCGCATGGPAPGAWGLLALALLRRRRGR